MFDFNRDGKTDAKEWAIGTMILKETEMNSDKKTEDSEVKKKSDNYRGYGCLSVLSFIAVVYSFIVNYEIGTDVGKYGDRVRIINIKSSAVRF